MASAVACAEAGARELFFDARSLPGAAATSLAGRLRDSLTIPFSVAVGSAGTAETRGLFEAGTSRVAIETGALADPDSIAELAGAFGSDGVAVVVEAEREDGVWRVRAGPAGAPTEWEAVDWARVIEAQGGGTIVVASRTGGAYGEPYDLDLLQAVVRAVEIPVLAWGEAKALADLFDALMIGDVDGVLVGSLLHSGAVDLPEAKRYLADHGIDVG